MAGGALTLVLCLAAAWPAAHASNKTQESNSTVPGAAFDRIFQVWLENGNYDEAAADENMKWLAGNGILLTNYYAVTHPSQPNYIAAVGGDTFGLQNDDAHSIPANVSTVVDLLETKGISWKEYEQGLPSEDFNGSSSGNYVRKHNPLISFDSISNNSTRMANIKKLSDFDDDLSSGRLPQWAFITPDKKNDGHDTSLSHGAKWLREWLEPLLKNDRFMKRTLILATFDENENYKDINRVYTVLLGGAVDKSLHNTTDSMYYNHYSAISSVSANWGLPSLGRWDCGANIFPMVANQTDYKNTNVSSYKGLWWNASYPGPLNEKEPTDGQWPKPDTEAKCASGRGVLPSVTEEWGKSGGSYNYTSVYPYDNSFEATKGGVPAFGVNDGNSSHGDSGVPTAGETGGAGSSRYYLVTYPLSIGTAFVWMFCLA